MELGTCHAIVTGGASGLGAATAAKVIGAGGKVTILDRDAERGEAKAAELGERARFATLDVTDEDGAVAAVTASVEAFGQLTLTVNCAGIGTPLLALTPICAFRPRRWRGALLPETTMVAIDVLDPHRRPVSATADYTEVRNVSRVEISQDNETSLTLMFDPEHNLEERIISEQFTP